MERNIDIEAHPEQLNLWVRKSIGLFNDSAYLDNIIDVYPLQSARPERLDPALRRQIIMAHQGRNTVELIRLLSELPRFPYEDPIWYLLRNIRNCQRNNPRQAERIAETLYAMTAEETVVRLEAAPKLNTQMGPMFTAWLNATFEALPLQYFMNTEKGIYLLDASEEDARLFVNQRLQQPLRKRPDLVVKVDRQYIIGEAKWIGQPGGNQEKQVQEVLSFCKEQRGQVIRIGIIDGFPWSVYTESGRMVNDKVAVLVQESEYDLLSALLLEEYLESYQSRLT